MKVSISDAAKMVGITRSTLYEHIKEKNISVIDADTKRPKIDVSELIRVYGDKVRALEEVRKDTKETISKDSNPDILALENASLKDKLTSLENERDRERRQLQAQIDNLQHSLQKEQEALNRIAGLLTNQSESTKGKDVDKSLSDKLIQLENSIASLKAANESREKKWFWQKA